MPEEYGNSIERDTGEQQLHGESIAESMRMAGSHFRKFKEPLKPSLPFSFGAANS